MIQRGAVSMVRELDTTSYYRGALRCLLFVEKQRPTSRRFGPEADARWASFHGELEIADRIDLLIRDADAQWPGCLGARAVFDRRAVAEDEPFGSGWEPLDPIAANELWLAEIARPAPATIADTLASMAAAWGLALESIEAGESITATDRLVVAGPGAISATIAAFARRSELDWAEQVLCVATPPAHRQLATAAAALLGATRPTRLVSAAPGTSTSSMPGYRLVLSAGATGGDAALARELASGAS